MFKIRSLEEQEIKNLYKVGGINDSCPIKPDWLKIVDVLHLDFDFNLKQGRLICLDIASENVLKIFQAMLEAQFPIESIRLMSDFNYNDEESMKANNSSCFCNRNISGTDIMSIHSYGLAIDVNPKQNPMISILEEENYYINAKIYPAGSGEYVNRDIPRAGMVEPVVDIFKKNGFDVWGGDWKNPLDYHHFQVNRQLAEKICIDDKNIRDELWARHLQSNLKHI
jgi:hypothetical protein